LGIFRYGGFGTAGLRGRLLILLHNEFSPVYEELVQVR